MVKAGRKTGRGAGADAGAGTSLRLGFEACLGMEWENWGLHQVHGRLVWMKCSKGLCSHGHRTSTSGEGTFQTHHLSAFLFLTRYIWVDFVR